MEGLIEIENPNRVSQKNKKVADVDVNAPKELSRRERWVSQRLFPIVSRFLLNNGRMPLLCLWGQSHLNLKHFICRPQLNMFLEGYFFFNHVSNLCLQSSLLVLLRASSWFSPKERRLRSRSQKSATTSSIARGRLIKPGRTWPGWPSSRNRGRKLPRREKKSGKVRRRHLEFPPDAPGWTCELVSNIHLETNW